MFSRSGLSSSARSGRFPKRDSFAGTFRLMLVSGHIRYSLVDWRKDAFAL